MRDFEVYWTAGRRALAGSALYRAEDGHNQLNYLPAFALAFVPFSLLPARRTRVAVSGSALVTMAFSIFDVMGRRGYAAFMSVSPITVCAVVIVLSVVYLRTRQLA